MLRRSALVLAAGSALAFAAADTGNAGTIYSDSISVTEAGGTIRTRDFKYYEPTGIGADAPLVIVLHGGGSDADAAISDPIEYEGLWNGRADAHGFYVVYPQGKLRPGQNDKRNWNDCRAPATAFDGQGNPTDGGMDPNNDNYSDWDDVTFINDLVDHFVSPPGGSGIEPVDPDRVYVLGLSNGGMMTQRLAIESPTKFKGFSTSVAFLPQKNECAAPDTDELRANGRKMLLLYGTADAYMPVNGGSIHNDPDNGKVLSATATINQWKTWWGASTSGTEVQQPNNVQNDGPSTQHWTYHCASTCPSGSAANMTNANIRLFSARVQGGGHNVPGVAPMPFLLRVIAQLGWRNLDAVHVDTMITYFGL